MCVSTRLRCAHSAFVHDGCRQWTQRVGETMHLTQPPKHTAAFASEFERFDRGAANVGMHSKAIEVQYSFVCASFQQGVTQQSVTIRVHGYSTNACSTGLRHQGLLKTGYATPMHWSSACERRRSVAVSPASVLSSCGTRMGTWLCGRERDPSTLRV